MLNLLSVLFAILALPFTLGGLLPIPFLSPALNIVAVVIAIIGVVLGALSSSNTGRNLSLIVLAISFIRLWLGGFFI